MRESDLACPLVDEALAADVAFAADVVRTAGRDLESVAAEITQHNRRVGYKSYNAVTSFSS